MENVDLSNLACAAESLASQCLYHEDYLDYYIGGFDDAVFIHSKYDCEGTARTQSPLTKIARSSYPHLG